MDEVGRNRIDALCRRHCNFALYRLPGEQEDVRFCMQADGGMSTRVAGESGFFLAPFDGTPLFLRQDMEAPPEAASFAPLPPRTPAHPATTPEEYERRFALYKSQLPSPLSKIVLARTEDVPGSGAEFSPAGAFHRICERSPRHFNALIHTAEHGTWLCSTPELLLRGNGQSWQTMALAGTRPAGEDEDAPWDEKNRREQQLVTDYILQCLEPLWSGGTLSQAHTLRTGAIEHLCTRFSFRMEAQLLERLLSTLPPTPAVCGYPLPGARAWLREQPDIERGLYAGYLGPVQGEDVHLYVTLRCMQIFADRCRLYAGGGLMPDSDAAAEWRETQAKMQPMRQLLTPSS